MITGAADGRSEYRQAWGEAGRDERLEPGGTATFSVGTASARGKAGEQTKSCQLLSISHPGQFGVAETVFDVVLFCLVLLGH